jgi:hypothetical protein
MNLSGRNQRCSTILLGVVLAALVLALYAGIFYFYQLRQDYTLKSWTDLEMQIVQNSARITQDWLNLRIQEQAVSKSQLPPRALGRQRLPAPAEGRRNPAGSAHFCRG